MKILGVIPARYASSRLPGKPLADIQGKPMIQHVYERAHKGLHEVVIATDDERIQQAAEKIGAPCIMTSKNHNSGTNRCLEAYEAFVNEGGEKPEVIINIQGDEPLLEPSLLQKLASCFEDPAVKMATLAAPVTDARDLSDPGVVFVVMSDQQDALYFSRFPIPYLRGVENRNDWLHNHQYYKHIGMYAYRPSALATFASLEMSSLEKAEALEQNRWLESGRSIRVLISPHENISVDTPADLARVREMMAGG